MGSTYGHRGSVTAGFDLVRRASQQNTTSSVMYFDRVFVCVPTGWSRSYCCCVSAVG